MSVEVKEYTAQSMPYAAISFLQSSFWARFKVLHGWTYQQYEVWYENQSVVLTVLLRKLSAFGVLAYVPMGPNLLIDEDARSLAVAKKRAALLTELAEKLVNLLPPSVFLLRFDPPWACSVKNNKKGTFSGADFPLIPHIRQGTFRCKGASSAIQPPDTVQLDLQQPLDAVFDDFKPKWRYNIRLAEKKGVTIQVFTGQQAGKVGVPLFYRLYQQTAARDGIAIHSQDYYRSLCDLAADHTHNTDHITLSVYAAFHQEEALAAIIVLFSPGEAVYLYGASSNQKRNLMPAYLLQWKAISDAHNAGCRCYDFYGIPPSDDPNHPMHGLYRFKTGFGGSIVHRVGSLDVPLKPLLYWCYAQAEWARSFWFKTIKKRFC
ncbi:MAG: lipid II:glycine glycyltransferase FemX [Treponema sp.]